MSKFVYQSLVQALFHIHSQVILTRKRIVPRAGRRANGSDCVRYSLWYSNEERQTESTNEFTMMISGKYI